MKALPSITYPTDLTDREWALLEPLLPPAKPGGRPRSVNLRVILNGLLYVLRSRLSVAVAATHVRPLVYGVCLLQSLASPGGLGAHPYPLAWSTAAARWA